jgi:hypothetical protein
MPEGVLSEVDGPYAYISFLDETKRGPALHALLETGAPIQVDTSGRRWVYIVPEGNAREAGLLDIAKKTAQSAPAAVIVPSAAPAPESPPPVHTAPPVAKKPPAKKAPAKKAPAKKAAPVSKGTH